MYARDIFLSHASPDKETHARPINEALRRQGISTWLDEAQITEGDNFVKSIAWGLDRAEIVLFIITENFIGRPWTEKELTTALSKEISDGTIRTIALIDTDDPEKVFRTFPLLRDKLYIRWDRGLDDISKRLAKRFSRQIATWHVFYHPQEYTGPIWTRIIPDIRHFNEVHKIDILWGPYHFSDEVQALSDSPISLTHHKIEADAIPMYVHVEPAAKITIGQGPPPDPDQINIDEGWVRLAGAAIRR